MYFAFNTVWFKQADFIETDFRFFGAVVEKPSSEEPFLDRRPIDIISSGDYNHLPMMIGYNDREGMAIDQIVPSRARAPFFENMEFSVPLALKVQRGSTLSKQIANEIRLFYFGDVKQTREEHQTQYFDVRYFYVH